MDGCIVSCIVISSCQSATTSDIVKALLATSSSHVRSAIPSTGLYLYLKACRAVLTYVSLAPSQTPVPVYILAFAV